MGSGPSQNEGCCPLCKCAYQAGCIHACTYSGGGGNLSPSDWDWTVSVPPPPHCQGEREWGKSWPRLPVDIPSTDLSLLLCLPRSLPLALSPSISQIHPSLFLLLPSISVQWTSSLCLMLLRCIIFSLFVLPLETNTNSFQGNLPSFIPQAHLMFIIQTMSHFTYSSNT